MRVPWRLLTVVTGRNGASIVISRIIFGRTRVVTNMSSYRISVYTAKTLRPLCICVTIADAVGFIVRNVYVARIVQSDTVTTVEMTRLTRNEVSKLDRALTHARFVRIITPIMTNSSVGFVVPYTMCSVPSSVDIWKAVVAEARASIRLFVCL